MTQSGITQSVWLRHATNGKNGQHVCKIYCGNSYELKNTKGKSLLAEPKAKKTPIATTRKHPGMVAWIFLFMIMAVLGLALVAFFVRVNVTIPFNVTWILVYIVSLLLLLGSLTILFKKRGAVIDVRYGSIKKYVVFLAGVSGFGILVAFSTFLGVPKALHYLSSEERQITVSVSGKTDLHQGRRSINRCRYRVFIKEFTNFPSNHLCVENEIYETINAADYLLLTGDASSFGISVKAVQVVPLQKIL